MISLFELSATTLLLEQANPSRSIKGMVVQIRQFSIGLALHGCCQAALNRVCKPPVSRLGRQSNSLDFKEKKGDQLRLDHLRVTDPLNENFETISIKPTKANIAIKLVTLA